MSDLKRKRPARRADHKTQAGNEKGTIEKIDIKTDKLRHTKKLKTAISNFYNMKESNINISE